MAFRDSLANLARHARGDKWPEFSDMSCANCHHALESGARRQERGWTGRAGLERLDDEGEGVGWTAVDWGSPEIEVRHSTDADAAAMHRAWQRLGDASGGIWRLSVQRVVPHLEVHLRPPDTAHVPAERLFRAVHDLAEELSQER
jgi:hypothetical protein